MPEILRADAVACDHRKVSIIGAGPSRSKAPWGDDSYCWWMLNEISQPRFDRHFELHPRAVQNDRELAWLSTCPTPCYVLDLDEWDGMIPQAVRYPLERVLAATGGRRYFTSTFAFQVALAITEGAAEIGVWGVDLDLGTLRERTAEKACLEYWLGMAEGRGIRVTLPPGATLLTRPYLYGYDYHDEKADIEAMCEDLVSALPQGEWPEGTVARITEAYDARVRAS